MEEWRPLRETNKYEASSYGRIRNADTGKILNGAITDRGRVRIYLRVDGIIRARYKHRLIAEAFWGTDCDGYDIYHKDGDTLNNRLNNLAIGTRAEAIQNSYKHKHDADIDNKRIRVVETDEIYDTLQETSIAVGLAKATITKCLRYESYHNIKGLHFELVDRKEY